MARVHPGGIMFELDGVPLEVAKEAFALAASKLPLATKMIVRQDRRSRNMTKISDIRANSADQLTEQLGNLKKEQFNMRFQRAAGETGSLGRVKLVRRDIARIKTVQGRAEARRGDQVQASGHSEGQGGAGREEGCRSESRENQGCQGEGRSQD